LYSKGLGIFNFNRKAIIWRIKIEPSDWFKNKLKSTSGGTFTPGKLYLFRYDPKWKHILPIYDKLPLSLVVSMKPGGFLGINIHYLDPDSRIEFFNMLRSMMQVQNGVIKQISVDSSILDIPLIKPCIKRYLYSHIMSRMIPIEDDEWFNIPFITEQQIYLSNILTAPLEQFVRKQ
jgi:hypothetical protein